MDFDFGAAIKLYENAVHPRVLIGPDDLDELKRRIRSGDGRKVMDAMRTWTRPLVDRVLNAGTEEETREVFGGAYFGTPVCFGLDDVAMVARLDDDEEALEAVRRFLTAMAAAEKAGREDYAYGSLRHQGMAYDLLFDYLSDEEREAISEWMIECGVRKTLEKISGFLKGAGANTYVCFMISALLNLLAVKGDPDVPDLGAEQKELLLMLEAALLASIGPDGYPVEDIGYGTALVPYLAYAVEAVRRAGLYDAYAQCPRYARFGRAVLHFVQPWGGHLTNTGDQYDGFNDRPFVLGRLAEMTGDATLRWLIGTLPQFEGPGHDSRFVEVTLEPSKRFHVPAAWPTLAVIDGIREQQRPSKARVPTQYRDRLRGIVSFRSGWKDDDTFVVFDGSQRSPSVMGHQHASCGNFTLSALGEYFAIDCGRYNMEQNCHNVVLAGGKSGRSTNGQWMMSWHDGLLTDYRPDEFVDFASVDSSLQHDCYWARRHLGLVKGRGAPSYVWMVEDINKANDWAEFWWQFHTSPENRIRLSRTKASIKGWRRGNWLDVHFALPDPGSYPRPHEVELSQDEATSSSFDYIRDHHGFAARFGRPSDMLHHSVFVRPRLVAKVRGYNGRFLSLLIPRRQGDRAAEVKRLHSLDNSLAVRVQFEKVEDTLIWAYEHHLLEAGDIRARGQWCLVRRSRASGRILNSTLMGDTRDEVGGQTPK